jgi:hypothetical protein
MWQSARPKKKVRQTGQLTKVLKLLQGMALHRHHHQAVEGEKLLMIRKKPQPVAGTVRDMQLPL